MLGSPRILVRTGSLTHVVMGAGIALGVFLGGCYGEYAGTTAAGGGDTGDGRGGVSQSTVDGGSVVTGANAPPGGTPTQKNNFDTDAGCTSNQTSPFNGDGFTGMAPGEACINCHSTGDGPKLHVAGTVYPTAHETASCVSTSVSLKVVITDHAGHVFELPTTQNGNFGCGDRARNGLPSCAGFVAPYNAYVVDSNNVYRAMGAQQTSGDCNTCHTTTGLNGAPGRIMAP